MPHSRWRGGSDRQAIAMTTALSPERMMLTPMICSAAIQNGACVMSCHMKSTGHPSSPPYAGGMPRPRDCSRFTNRAPARSRNLADDLVAGKELRDLFCRSVRRVGTMHRILADRLRVHLADGPVRRLVGIGRPHHVAILGDRALAFQHLHHDGAGGHERAKLAEERPLAVHAVEGLGLFARDAHALLRHDAQARDRKSTRLNY